MHGCTPTGLGASATALSHIHQTAWPPRALQFAAAVIYAAAKELLLQPKEYTCYSQALDRIKDDPRVTVRLGAAGPWWQGTGQGGAGGVTWRDGENSHLLAG